MTVTRWALLVAALALAARAISLSQSHEVDYEAEDEFSDEADTGVEAPEFEVADSLNSFLARLGPPIRSSVWRTESTAVSTYGDVRVARHWSPSQEGTSLCWVESRSHALRLAGGLGVGSTVADAVRLWGEPTSDDVRENGDRVVSWLGDEWQTHFVVNDGMVGRVAVVASDYNSCQPHAPPPLRW